MWDYVSFISYVGDVSEPEALSVVIENRLSIFNYLVGEYMVCSRTIKMKINAP